MLFPTLCINFNWDTRFLNLLHIDVGVQGTSGLKECCRGIETWHTSTNEIVTNERNCGRDGHRKIEHQKLISHTPTLRAPGPLREISGLLSLGLTSKSGHQRRHLFLLPRLRDGMAPKPGPGPQLLIKISNPRVSSWHVSRLFGKDAGKSSPR